MFCMFIIFEIYQIDLLKDGYCIGISRNAKEHAEVCHVFPDFLPELYR